MTQESRGLCPLRLFFDYLLECGYCVSFIIGEFEEIVES